jgi:hypothetical protein
VCSGVQQRCTHRSGHCHTLGAVLCTGGGQLKELRERAGREAVLAASHRAVQRGGGAAAEGVDVVRRAALDGVKDAAQSGGAVRWPVLAATKGSAKRR